jgi:hypothetical protein
LLNLAADRLDYPRKVRLALPFRNMSVLKSAAGSRTILENDMRDDEIVRHGAKNGAPHLEEAKVPADSHTELPA